jgi:hypothetical protein
MATGRVPTTANSPLTAKGDLFTYSTTQARLAVGNDGETLLADSSTSTGLRWQGSQAAGKNAIINGAFDIWQRSTSAAIAAGSYVAADRWYTFRSVAGSTFSRQTASLTGFQYSGRIARDSGNTSTANISCGQSIESVNSIPFAGQTIVFSFWAKAGANYSATSSILRVRLLSSTTTDQNIVLNGGTTVIDQNATLTTSWQRFSYSASVGSTVVTLGTIFSYDPVGTAGAADNFEVTGVQVELGSVATAFQTATGTIQGELAACQRYYYRNSSVDANTIFGSGWGWTSTQGYVILNPKVTMRTKPSALDYSAIALQALPGGTTYAITSWTLDTGLLGTDTISTIPNVASGLTASLNYRLIGTSSSAYIGLSAEL